MVVGAGVPVVTRIFGVELVDGFGPLVSSLRRRILLDSYPVASELGKVCAVAFRWRLGGDHHVGCVPVSILHVMKGLAAPSPEVGVGALKDFHDFFEGGVLGEPFNDVAVFVVRLCDHEFSANEIRIAGVEHSG